jgi:hypothetical protein
MNHDVREQE